MATLESPRFTLFPKLPAELRLKILQFALPVKDQPRIIDIGTGEKISLLDELIGLSPPKNRHARSFTPNSAALHVCQEFRQEALKVYQLLESNSDGKDVPRAFIRPEFDTLFLVGDVRGPDWPAYAMDTRNIKNVAVLSCRRRPDRWWQIVQGVVRNYPDLRDLTIVQAVIRPFALQKSVWHLWPDDEAPIEFVGLDTYGFWHLSNWFSREEYISLRQEMTEVRQGWDMPNIRVKNVLTALRNP